MRNKPFLHFFVRSNNVITFLKMSSATVFYYKYWGVSDCWQVVSGSIGSVTTNVYVLSCPSFTMEATFDLGFDLNFGDAFDEETNSILSAIDGNELHERNDYDNTNNSIGSSTSKNTGTDTANLSRSDTTLPTTRSSTSKNKNRFATKSKEDLLEIQ